MKTDYTIREIADILETSKTTVVKIAKSLEIEYDYVKSNRQYYSAKKTIAIIKGFKPNFDVSSIENQVANSQTNSQSEDTNSQTKSANLQTESENSQTSQGGMEIELMRSMLTTLQEQLKIKDTQIAAYEEQIANQNKQIQDYSERLKEAMELTKGQQFIAAADKKAQLLEHQENDEPIDIDDISSSEDAIEHTAAYMQHKGKSEEENKQEQPQKKGFFKRLLGR